MKKIFHRSLSNVECGMHRAGLLLAVLLVGSPSLQGAVVNLTLFNTEALLDSDVSTPLAGTASSGDLVQLVFIGLNSAIDAPDVYGQPGGDDLFLTQLNNPTHVGAGLMGTNDGLLAQADMLFADSYVGASVFVRFWNGRTAAAATHYGNSDLFTLTEVFPGLAQLDFVPTTGSDRVTDTAFSALAMEMVPEPGSLGFICVACAVFFFRCKFRQWAKQAQVLALLLVLGCSTSGLAQLTPPWDVMAGGMIVDHAGLPLKGSNPYAAAFGHPVVPGALVQILDAGPDGLPDLPDEDGRPTGDDTICFETAVGVGMAPNLAQSGRFSLSRTPAPGGGKKLYARVFNAPTRGAATHWGQSIAFEVTGAKVMDLSRLGLWGTTQPMGTDPLITDSDGDGVLDTDELTANTSAVDAGDLPEVAGLTPGFAGGIQIQMEGRGGRRYTLERSTDALTGPMSWQPIAVSPVLILNRDLVLQDPDPPATNGVFYRTRVSMFPE